jgi:hypothetical protein
VQPIRNDNDPPVKPSRLASIEFFRPVDVVVSGGSPELIEGVAASFGYPIDELLSQYLFELLRRLRRDGAGGCAGVYSEIVERAPPGNEVDLTIAVETNYDDPADEAPRCSMTITGNGMSPSITLVVEQVGEWIQVDWEHLSKEDEFPGWRELRPLFDVLGLHSWPAPFEAEQEGETWVLTFDGGVTVRAADLRCDDVLSLPPAATVLAPVSLELLNPTVGLFQTLMRELGVSLKSREIGPSYQHLVELSLDADRAPDGSYLDTFRACAPDAQSDLYLTARIGAPDVFDVSSEVDRSTRDDDRPYDGWTVAVSPLSSRIGPIKVEFGSCITKNKSSPARPTRVPVITVTWERDVTDPSGVALAQCLAPILNQLGERDVSWQELVKEGTGEKSLYREFVIGVCTLRIQRERVAESRGEI